MLLDLRMDGMEVYAMAQECSPPATITDSAHIDVQTAVLATRAGVQDVMQKPVPEEILTARIRELAAQRRALREPSASQPRSGIAEESLLRLVGASDKARELREQVRRVAQFCDVPVLIQGPTGTGKELVAQAVHALTCPDEPFVSVNCAADPRAAVRERTIRARSRRIHQCAHGTRQAIRGSGSRNSVLGRDWRNAPRLAGQIAARPGDPPVPAGRRHAHARVRRAHGERHCPMFGARIVGAQRGVIVLATSDGALVMRVDVSHE
jgi:Sigma-54 interaction domain